MEDFQKHSTDKERSQNHNTNKKYNKIFFSSPKYENTTTKEIKKQLENQEKYIRDIKKNVESIEKNYIIKLNEMKMETKNEIVIFEKNKFFEKSNDQNSKINIEINSLKSSVAFLATFNESDNTSTHTLFKYKEHMKFLNDKLNSFENRLSFIKKIVVNGNITDERLSNLFQLFKSKKEKLENIISHFEEIKSIVKMKIDKFENKYEELEEKMNKNFNMLQNKMSKTNCNLNRSFKESKSNCANTK